MSKKLIVHADDFGLCEAISLGILKACIDGIVTSTSIVANGDYFQPGLGQLKESGLDTGVHLTFTGGERPVTGPINGLVDEQGRFLESFHNVLPRIILGRYDKAALRRELTGQITLVLDHGISISHLDSHQHLHLLPAVREMVVELARQFGIHWIRLPKARGRGLWSPGVNILSRGLKNRLIQNDLRYSDHNFGFRESGHMVEERLFALLNQLGSGITELMVHPGYDASNTYSWGFEWESELAALTSAKIKEYISKQAILLTNFKEL
jgi:predicted glycoside hydrolase/deacetylase ChbG (UPF0249 family)